jgi:alpha-2-macroglobulin
MRNWILLLVLLLASPITGQESDAVFFGLTANRTFAPGEKAVVQIWAQNIRSLDLRLYRVDKPAEFLGNLPDPHSFGNNTATLPKERTPIERFHTWKRNLRTRAQLFLRSQFTPEARDEWRARDMKKTEAAIESANKKTAAQKGAEFAAVPILNEKLLLKSWKQAITTRQRWDEQPLDIPVKDPGLYLVEATDGKLRAYTLVSVSSMAVLTKTEPGKSIARVVDRISGRALEGVDVDFRAAGKSFSTAKTDAQGFASLKAAEKLNFMVVATKGTDVAFDALNEYSLNTDDSHRSATYIYTERPVYRPGHKVFFKAVLRRPSQFGWELPKFSSMDAEVTDNSGKAIWRKSLTVSSFGSVHGEFDLPMTAGLGYYGIKLTAGTVDGYGSFQVEEYKKPEYEVKVKTARPRVLQGDTVEATISGRYFFGEPVKGAKVTYTVRKARYYPYWYEPAESEGGEGEEGSEGGDTNDFFSGEQGEEITGKLDDNGELKIKLPTPVIDQDYLYRIEAKVMDEGNREVTGYGMLTVTHGTFMAIISPDRYVYEPGANGSFTVTLKDYDGKPIQSAFRAEIRRWSWRNPEQNKILETASGSTDIGGTGKVSFRLPEGGSYNVTVTARTPEGRDVKNDSYVWVSGNASIFDGGEQERIQLITDKKKYAPGDTAKVLVLTGQPDTDVWITVEARGIIESRSVKGKDASGFTFEVPIKPEFAPNVSITASFLKAGKLFEGRKLLKVPPVEKELSINLTPSKQEFKPGEPARYDVEVKDNKGQPVRAELSLGIVDEALYAVQRDMTQPPLATFYGNRYSEVNSSNSLSYYFRGEAGQKAMRLAKLRPSLGQLKPDRVGDPRVRKAFPDTAFWTADLVTDSAGKGKVDFAFPDALTMWRATARGFTTDTRVGQAINRVIVRKNLMLRTVNPRFLMEGDETTIGVIVQNYLSTAKSTKVSLAATGVDLLDGNERTVTVDSKGISKVEFRIRVKPGKESVITAKGITDEESDAMEITLPIKPYGTLLSEGRSGALSERESTKLTLKAPGGNRTIEVSLAPSMAGSILGALDYLTAFPYGCTEQTMSSFLPNVTVKQAMDELKIKTNVNPDELRKKVTAGTERLLDYQHSDGAWGWWKNDDSHPFMTAHVIAGLKEAKSAGYEVDEAAIKRGENWLRAEFRRQADAKADLRSYIAYALGAKEDVEAVWSSRSRMTSYGLAFLGLALDRLKDPRAIEVAQSLEAMAVQDASGARWPGTRDPLLDFVNDITPETTSYVLKLLARTRPTSPLLPKAAIWLVSHKDQGQYWNSTKQTAMVIYGMIDYLKVSGELKPDISATVRVNGKDVLSKDFGEADVMSLQPVRIEVPAGDSNDIEVSVRGKGRVYWNAQASYYSTEEGRKPSTGDPMSASREYFRLVPRESGGTTTYTLEPLSGDIKPGDAIAALLTVQAPNWSYILIEEPIPAGFELVTKDNVYNLSGSNRPSWWSYAWAQREFRDDRVAFFRTYFYKADNTFFYVMKAVNPGKFRVPATRVQPMYQPQEVATGKNAVLEVKQ